jgi:phospholipid/cholesterol/gamma-HCH transport system ATP-binding protein
MIAFKSVIKKFDARTVLNDITFDVSKGEILFILGTSGTGKSVLLKNLIGLLKPTSGEIWIDKKEVSHLSEEDYFPVRKMCGMVFQNPALFDSLSVFENVAFGLRKHLRELNAEQIQKRVHECLQLVQLKAELGTKMPSEISYGMQKRVAIARAVAVSPPILLFDEPTTGLDPVTTRAINHLILDLSHQLKTTSLVVSHDMSCALEIADRIIVLDQGKIVEQGTPHDLKKSEVPLVQDFLREALENATADA